MAKRRPRAAEVLASRDQSFFFTNARAKAAGLVRWRDEGIWPTKEKEKRTNKRRN